MSCKRETEKLKGWGWGEGGERVGKGEHHGYRKRQTDRRENETQGGGRKKDLPRN